MKHLYTSALACAALAMASFSAQADTISLDPADGAKVGYLQSFVYTTDDTSASLGTDMFQTQYPYLTDAEGKTYEFVNKNQTGLNKNQIRFELVAPVTAPGQYTLTVKEGMIISGGGFFGGGTAMPGVTAQYTVTGEGLDKVTFAPAQGTVKSLDKLTITFADAQSVAVAEGAKLTVYDGNGFTATTIAASALTVAGNVVTAALEKPIVEADSYVINIPAGSFLLGADKVASTPQSYYFTVDPSAPAEYEALPAEGIINRIDTILVAFPAATKVALGDAPQATINFRGALDAEPADGLGSWKANFYEYKVNDEGMAQFSLTSSTMGNYYAKKINGAPGYYAVKIYAGAFLLGEDKTPSPEIILYYTLDPNYAPESWTIVLPQDGTTAEQFDEFIINFDGATTAEHVAGIDAVVNSPKEGETENYTKWFCNVSNITKVEGENAMFSACISSPNMGNYYVNKLAKTPGDYMLKVPAGAFLIGKDKVASDEIKVYFTVGTPVEEEPEGPVTSITNVRIEMGGQAYSLDGRQLERGAKGLMIIGGAKAIIK